MAEAYPVSDIAGVREGKRIAVVGTGIAGLTAAFLLSRKHHVTVLERESSIGMDAHSVDYMGARMDIPLRVFSEAYYPNLCNIYKLLGVKYRTADYSFNCIASHTSPAAYFRYVNLFFAGMALPIPFVLSLRHAWKCARLAYQFAHFVQHSPTYMLNETDQLTLSDFLVKYGYSLEFGSELLFPMLSVVCTCSYAAVKEYPADIIVDYFANKYGLSGAQCRAYGGTRDVVARLTKPVARCIINANVTAVEPQGAAVNVIYVDADGRQHKEQFDDVVLATQANACSRLLKSTNRKLLDTLCAFEYEKKRVVLHTDASLMPSRKRDWSPLNIVVDEESTAASVTVWMNRIDQGLKLELQGPLFQTWNPIKEPRAGTVRCDYAFERPVVNSASVRAMQELRIEQGRDHIWFVGAYSRYSMPLLENGVKSAIEVSRSLGVDCSDVEFDEATVPGKNSTYRSTIMCALLLVGVSMLMRTAAHATRR